ncbi:MAG: hypothetical protein LAT75_04200 [Candidatus Cyclonatronum sp.]|uniref:hypothetical protein n=1 Tax=Cyclonatronum sp. TaxID=3024185 RepID=UPI0025BEEE71|nr:hypothetical protein [Cyclonatronum sp.]MCC5932658.1 hypothetical protein [Balneolales bacterium]MCH8486042.1 hypothetical protein [Cyclonatronum sp.]
MAKFSTSQLFITAVSAFAGGVLCAWLSSPRSGADNRKWITDSTHGLKNKVKESGKGIKTKNFPDLYEATEDLGLTEEDLLSGTR